MTRPTLALAALVLAAPLAAQQDTLQARLGAPGALSLTDALARAEATSEALGIAKAGVQRARGQLRQARSGLYPQLTGSASYQRVLKTQFSSFVSASGDSARTPTGPCNGFRPSPNLPLADRVDSLERAVDCSVNSSPFGNGRIPFGQPNTWNFGLSATLTLFDAKLYGQVGAAEAQRGAAELDYASARAKLVLDVAAAYYDAVLADRLLGIADSTLAQAERTLHDVELGRQVGTQPEFDLLRARVARDNQKPIVLQRRVQRDQAFLRFRQLLDLPLDAPLVLVTPLDAAEAPALPPGLAGIASPDTAALTRAPVRSAEATVRASEQQLRAANGERWPVLSAGSDYARIGFGREFFPPLREFVDDWSLNVKARVPLFTGGRLSGSRMAARAGVEESRLRLKLAREQAERDNRLVVQTLEAAEATLAATTGTVEQARRAYEIAELRFREGLSTQTELADARIQRAQAEANRAQAARDLQVARLRLALLRDLPLGTADAALGAAAQATAAR